MPVVVDREQVKKDILLAFERCMVTIPMANVSLRDIAKEAGMSHANLLNYFTSKDDLIVSYVKYVQAFIGDRCKEWFATHSRKRYKSNLSYLNAFMAYVANGKAGEKRPNATTQIYVLARYNPAIAALIEEEFAEWRKVMEDCLVKVYGDEVGKKEAEVMTILVAGTFICNYNHVLTGKVNDNIIGLFGNLAKE